MEPAVTSPAPPLLAEKQRAALISLLADDDPAIYQIVRGKLLTYGQAAGHWLRPHALSDDPILRRRAREIIALLARQTADRDFLSFCLSHGEDLDLELGTGLLAQTQFPDVHIEAYRALYDSWAGELRERIDPSADPEHILGAINRYLFEDLLFTADEEYSVHPESSYLNHVVDFRRGNPIGLCSIYLFLTRRLRLPVVGIGLPGHFICRYQSPTREIYIDLFRRGRFLTKNDCIKYLLQTHHGLQEGYLAPVSPRRVLLRMCANLHSTYAHREMAEEAARVQRYVVALTRREG
jgi:regulator of sirC expression with transglutaminase-like and TPR domain